MNVKIFAVVLYLYICEAPAVPIEGITTKNPKWFNEAALRLGQQEPLLKLSLNNEQTLDAMKNLLFEVYYELAKEKGEKEEIRDNHEAEKGELRDKHEAEKEELRDKHEAEKEELRDKHEAEKEELQDKQETENKLLKDKIITLNTSLISVYPFVRLLSCNEYLRYGMEILPILYSHENIIKQDLKTLYDKTNKTWTKRTKDLTHIVARISSIIKKDSTLSEFENAWQALKNLHLTKHTYARSTDLSLQLLKLNDSVDADSAFQSCKSDDTFWRTFRDIESLSVEQNNSLQDITKLSRKELEELLPPHYGDRLQDFEIQLASDYMEIGGEPRRLKQPSLERYDICTWILHRVDKSEIANISAQIEAEWPHLSRAQRIEQYCTDFVQLYSLVSTATMHKPAPPPPGVVEEKCLPGTEDYEKFLVLIGSGGNARMAFVARTVVSISTNVKMPSKKITQNCSTDNGKNTT